MRHDTKIVYYDLHSLVADQHPDYLKYPVTHKFRCRCPFCPEGKTPALSILGSLRVGICFRCDLIFRDRVDMNPLTTEELTLAMDSYHRIEGGTEVLDPNIFELFDPVKDNRFLSTRNKYVSDWNIYGIKQGDHEVITPYYLFGELLYYQIRYYDPRGFYNPKNIQAPIYVPNGTWYPGKSTILVEGPFDAIAMDCVRKYLKIRFNIAALGGKVINEYRLKLLHLLGTEDIFICLDETSLSEQVHHDLVSEFRSVSVIPSDGRDPEEMLRDLGLEDYSEYIYSHLDVSPPRRRQGSFEIQDMNIDNFSIHFGTKYKR